MSEHPGHEGEARLARDDFEKLVQLEPGNVEGRKELSKLRSTARLEQKELDKSQRDSFKGMFGKSDKPLYEDAPKVEVAPILRKTDADKHPLVLTAEDVHFHYEKKEPVLKGMNLELRSGWCVGLVGNNASGKTTLVRLFMRKHFPITGNVVHHGVTNGAPASKRTTAFRATGLGSALVGVLAVLARLALSRVVGQANLQKLQDAVVWWHWLVLAALTLIVVCVIKFGLEQLDGPRTRHLCLEVTSDSQDKEDISGKKTIEQVIGELLPKSMSKEERRAKVVAMLQASGFAMYNQDTGEVVGTPEEHVRNGLKYGHLSGGQKHLMYVLRSFAQNPAVMLCDELLGGLDAYRQPRVLRMLRRLQQERGTAVLYITTELHQLRLMADSLGFLSDGKIVELGPCEDVFDFPKHPIVKEYLSLYRGLPGCQRIGGKLAENYTALEGDGALAGPWLPPPRP